MRMWMVKARQKPWPGSPTRSPKSPSVYWLSQALEPQLPFLSWLRCTVHMDLRCLPG